MTTVTISLPEKIAKKMDEKTKQEGFATRSEFVRSLLRSYFSEELSFEEFAPISLEGLKFELTRTGKYSEKFIESVVKGFKKSSLYAKQRA